MADIHELARPTTDEALQRRMVEIIREVLEMAESGNLAAVVIVPIRVDQSFRVRQAGLMRRLQTVGYLAQAQFDLLDVEDEVEA